MRTICIILCLDEPKRIYLASKGFMLTIYKALILLILYYRGFHVKGTLSYLCALGIDRFEREYTPSTFYMKSAVLNQQHTCEVNPYKKSCYFCKPILCTLVDQGVHPFFSFPTNIFSNKVKKVCYEMIFIISL